MNTRVERLRAQLEEPLLVSNPVNVRYHPGLGGIRIEDLVVVHADGPEVLTSFTKELVTVG